MSVPVFKRVLLKLSGESLMGEESFGIDPKVSLRLADEIQEISQLGVEIAIVIGGGNIFRGMRASQMGMERVSADHMGMLATVINALALQDSLEKRGVVTRVMSAVEMREVAEPYIRRRAIRHLERGRVVDYLEVLDSERTLFDAELVESSIQRQALIAFVTLYKALGGGWSEDEDVDEDVEEAEAEGAGA